MGSIEHFSEVIKQSITNYNIYIYVCVCVCVCIIYIYISYKNVCKNAAFSFQLIEKILGNGSENGITDHFMLEY